MDPRTPVYALPDLPLGDYGSSLGTWYGFIFRNVGDEPDPVAVCALTQEGEPRFVPACDSNFAGPLVLPHGGEQGSFEIDPRAHIPIRTGRCLGTVVLPDGPLQVLADQIKELHRMQRGIDFTQGVVPPEVIELLRPFLGQ